MRRNVIIIFSSLIAIFLAVFAYTHNWFSATSNVSVRFSVPTPTPDPMGSKNILLLGYGGGTHDGALLTDTIIVAHIVPKDKRIIFITIPRDTWVTLPITVDGVQEKLNAAYADGYDTKKYLDRPTQYTGKNGGGNLASYAVQQVVGLPIDGYAAVSFDGFKQVLKILGPIPVTVPYTFEDKFYPIEGKEKDTCGKTPEEMQQVAATASGDLLEQQYTCRYETVAFEKGIQAMDADVALKFVRSRHSETNPGDFYRSLRQQALIQGVINELKTLGGIVKLPAVIPQVVKFIDTNITIAQLLSAIKTYSDPLSFKVGRIALTDDNALISSVSTDGQYILIPRDGSSFDSVHQYIADRISELTATPSATVTPSTY